MKNKLRVFWAIMASVALVYSLYPLINCYLSANNVMKYGAYAVVGIVSIMVSFFLVNKTCGRWVRVVETSENKERKIGMDVVRVVAVSLVILTHYIIRRGYYQTPVEGTGYFWATIVRYIALCCCPLFMILTGFFMYNRKVDKKHYSNLLHWFRNYCLLCIIVLFLWNESQVTRETIKSLVSLSRYWYINMYFGLFLLAPFLNAMWHSLEAEKKKWLIAVLVLLASFSSVTNTWWTTYWNALYPFIYYFIGMWLRENELKVKKLPAVLMFLGITLIESVFTMYVNPGEVFVWAENYGGYSCSYNAIPIVIKSCIIVLLLKDIKIKNKVVQQILIKISQNSLEIYLFACMYVDNLVFPKIWSFWAPKIGQVGVFFILLPVEVVMITVFSIVLNKVCDFLQAKCGQGIRYLMKKD